MSERQAFLCNGRSGKGELAEIKCLPSQFRKEYVNMGTECCETDSFLAIHVLAYTLWKVCTGVIALQLADFSQIKKMPSNLLLLFCKCRISYQIESIWYFPSLLLTLAFPSQNLWSRVWECELLNLPR